MLTLHFLHCPSTDVLPPWLSPTPNKPSPAHISLSYVIAQMSVQTLGCLSHGHHSQVLCTFPVPPHQVLVLCTLEAILQKLWIYFDHEPTKEIFFFSENTCNLYIHVLQNNVQWILVSYILFMKNWLCDNCTVTYKKTKLYPHLISCTTFNSKWILYLNITAKPIKLLGKKQTTIFVTLGWAKRC